MTAQLPGQVELLVRQHTQLLLPRAALNPFSTQPVFVLGIVLTHVQDLGDKTPCSFKGCDVDPDYCLSVTKISFSDDSL